jgi:hypothetical protein
MTNQYHDRAFLDHLNFLINTGMREVDLPRDVVERASEEALNEARRLCKLTGVTMKGIRFGTEGASSGER